jgi:hypothetical protein
MSDDPKPTHPWNDPDNDGHNCIDCPTWSIWRCDEAVHLNVQKVIQETQQALKKDLEAMARTRRTQRTDQVLG